MPRVVAQRRDDTGQRLARLVVGVVCDFNRKRANVERRVAEEKVAVALGVLAGHVADAAERDDAAGQQRLADGAAVRSAADVLDRESGADWCQHS